MKKKAISESPLSMPNSIHADREALVNWYIKNRRALPWRMDQDPYRIWISEVMLQQTTVAAVVPFYERFLLRFPTLANLANAPLESVLESWTGLGYYSRARNLHKAAQALQSHGFPKTHDKLLDFPGFGPYTARAVASLAFNEKVGVLDGNVIRVLCRKYGWAIEWWKPQGRGQLQEIADALAATPDVADLNQGLMELGATVCTPQSPACLLCPWTSTCEARAKDRIADLPLKRPRREREIWIWEPVLAQRKGQVALVQNDYAPFLKGQWMYPGKVRRVQRAPKTFDYRHSVTHHDIFVIVTVAVKGETKSLGRSCKWIPVTEIHHWNPTTLVKKALRLPDRRLKRSDVH